MTNPGLIMTALIIDDEDQARETLSFFFRKYFPELKVVGEAANIIEGCRLVHEKLPDIIFLDVSMPVASGFELAELVDFSSTFVVFVTGHSEFTLDAFRVNAADYLLKPVQITELTRVINKARSAISSKKTPVSGDKKIMLKYKGKVHVINEGEVVSIKSEGNYTDIFLANKDRILITRNMKKVEEEYFSGLPFFRTHQSYIINLNRVVEYDANEILLDSGDRIPLVKAKYPLFRSLMGQISGSADYV